MLEAGLGSLHGPPIFFREWLIVERRQQGCSDDRIDFAKGT